MITYNNIHEARISEQTTDRLQKLPDNFIEDIKSYIREKKEIASKEDDEFSEIILKTKKQLENALTLFKEILRIRKKKILSLVLIASETGISKQDFENMLDFEKELFESLMESVEKSNNRLGKILSDKPNGKTKVIFKEDVEEFAGLDGETIGPFKEGEEAEIPSEISEILLLDSKIEIINN
jgi:DNA replication initiation complex subunit (GINS family)